MTETITFEPFPKLARLNRDIVITEKIDGTNAAVIITEDGQVGAQSRKRLITPQDDNFGFARWVAENEDALRDTLGPGRHFGEWWGSGVQRGYGLAKGEKRFSLFNVARWQDTDLTVIPGVSTVPLLAEWPRLDTESLGYLLDDLRVNGSVAAPGFMQPEGVVIWHTAARTLFKVTLEDDDKPKGMVNA